MVDDRWESARHAVSQDGSPEALSRAIDFLFSDDAWAKDMAVKELVRVGKAGDARVVPALCDAIVKSIRLATVGDGIVTLPTGTFGDIPVHRTGRFGSLGDRPRCEIAGILVLLGDPRAVETLCLMLKGSSASEVYVAAEGLATLRDPRAVESLCEVLPSINSFDVGKAVVRALGKIGDVRAVDALLRAMTSTGLLGLHENAADAIVAIGDHGAVEPLCDLLRTDQREFVRVLAAKTLGRLGDARALPVLRERSRFFGDEPQRGVRRACRAAIDMITSASTGRARD